MFVPYSKKIRIKRYSYGTDKDYWDDYGKEKVGKVPGGMQSASRFRSTPFEHTRLRLDILQFRGRDSRKGLRLITRFRLPVC